MEAWDMNGQPKQIATPTGNPEEWLVGMVFHDAAELLRQRGMALRIARNQGVACAITADHRPFRWNIEVDFAGRIIDVLGRG